MNASDLPAETLFEEALQCRTPEERTAYLDKVCAGQPGLRKKLEALLEAHDQSGQFLEAPAIDSESTASTVVSTEEATGAPSDENRTP